MSMRTYRLVLLAIAAGIILICLLTLLIAPDSPDPPEKYLLREYEQRLAVFRPGEDDPMQILPVYAATLPYADRLRLQQGISVESEEALQQLIEDLTS